MRRIAGQKVRNSGIHDFFLDFPLHPSACGTTSSECFAFFLKAAGRRKTELSLRIDILFNKLHFSLFFCGNLQSVSCSEFVLK